ncbi:unnamed protein product [Mucor hiemalis]
MSSDNKSQNIRTYNMETKRYAAPQNLKDSFYAIHHIQKTIKENNERILQQSENTAPTLENVERTVDELRSKKSVTTTTTTTVRGRKRIAPELIHKLAPAADSPPPPHNLQNESVKRKKSRQQNTKAQRKSNTTAIAVSAAELPSLYQTCVGLWPEQQSLGDYSHDNIKSLSNLLKVRLCQAKFKMLGTLEQDNELFSFLAEECASPKPRSPHSIKFSGKQSKFSLSIVGNGKNLFSRHQNRQYHYDTSLTAKTTTTTPMKDDTYLKQAHTPKDNMACSPQRTPLTTKSKERKKKTPRNNATKTTTKKSSTPKRKSAAADVTPIVQSDGSSVYLCIPCEKKYKNRNGLAYHLERCKYTAKQEEEQTSQNGDNVINCVCSQNTDEHGTMVQCDKCRVWLHSECVGLTDDNSDEVYHCNTCKESNNNYTTKSGTSTSPNDLLQSLLDAQQSQSDREDILSQNIHDIFSQTTGNDDTQSDDDFPVEEDEANSEMNHEIPSSTQLHVWDDFSFAEQLDSSNNNNKSNEPWSMLDEDEPFSSYDNDIPSSSWTMNDINIFSQPPSLLFSEATLSSALEDDINSVPLIGDLSTDPQQVTEATPLNESTPNCTTPSRCEVTTPSVVSTNTPVHTADGLWFQFANFDDDYHCET